MVRVVFSIIVVVSLATGSVINALLFGITRVTKTRQALKCKFLRICLIVVMNDPTVKYIYKW